MDTTALCGNLQWLLHHYAGKAPQKSLGSSAVGGVSHSGWSGVLSSEGFWGYGEL